MKTNKTEKKPEKKQEKSQGLLIGLLAVTALLIAAVCFLFFFGKKEEKKPAPKPQPQQAQEQEKSDVITHNGQKYKYNYKLRNILFMGVDKPGEMKREEVGHGGQTDSLILLVMDKENQKTTVLEISRETMVDLRAYDMNGDFLGTEQGQITLQYSYGDGQKRSCQLTKQAVSDLLYGIPIHSYMALTLKGFEKITDGLGGVELTIPEDYTDINPRFEKGKTITLQGKEAEQYVRTRDITVSGSNEGRMNRQSQFLGALAKKIQLKGKENPNWYVSLVDDVAPYMATDIQVDEMAEMSKYEMEDTIEMVPGEVRQGEKHDEFIVDNEKLKDLVIKMFYKPVE